MSASTRTFNLRSDVRFRRVADEGVVVILQACEILVLNATGAQVLELFREGRSLTAVGEILRGRQGVALERVMSDLDRFVAELIEANVLKEAPSNTTEAERTTEAPLGPCGDGP